MYSALKGKDLVLAKMLGVKGSYKVDLLHIVKNKYAQY